MIRRGILLAGLLAACQPTEGTGETDTCGAEGYRSLIGANLAAVLLPADLNARVIGPDTAVTMDFVPERLNIEVDDEGNILRLRCG